MRWRSIIPAVVALGVAALAVAALLAGAASASPSASGFVKRFGGMMRDVPTGTHVAAHMTLAAPVLPYNGGPVLHANRTHVIFWDPTGSGLTFDPGYQTLIETFLTDVAADSHRTTNAYALSAQYTDRTGRAAYDSTYGGAVVATDPLPANGCTEPAATGPGWSVCMTDAQLENEIEHVIAVDNLPTNATRDVYFLVMPDGLGSCTDSSSSSCALGGSASGYCGYHSQTPTGVLYAVIPYNAVPGHCQSANPRPNSSTADPTISTISHEHNEMVTDPEGDAWIDGQGNEEADLCLTQFGSPIGGTGATAWNESIHGGHFYIQELWSNANNGCEQRAEPDAVSFGLRRGTARKRQVSFVAHGWDPEGRMVSFEWFFGDGHAGFGRRVLHAFKTPGSYRVMLRATDSWDNWTFAGRTVRVRGR